MALTPVDILHTQFKSTLRGYNKGQVDEFLRNVREALETAIDEKAELMRKISTMQDEVDRVQQIESTLTSALTLAQKAADELRVNAHRQAEMILQEAEQARVKMTVDTQREAESHRCEIGMLHATRDRFESEFRAMLNGYLSWLEKGWPTEVIARVPDVQHSESAHLEEHLSNTPAEAEHSAPFPMAGEGRGVEPSAPSPLAGEGWGVEPSAPSPLAGEGWGEGDS